MKLFSCDFETSTWEDDKTRVWAWSSCEIGKFENINYGNDIDSFFNFIKNQKNCKCYFHNLAFDGNFIIYYLLTHGYKHIEHKKDRKYEAITFRPF